MAGKQPVALTHLPLRGSVLWQRGSDITGIASPYAWLSMEVAQVTDSLEEITEIDPLNIAEILGNIGGFWGELTE